MDLIQFTSKCINWFPVNFCLDPWKPVDVALIAHGDGNHKKWE